MEWVWHVREREETGRTRVWFARVTRKTVMARENCGSSRFEDKSQEFGLGQVKSEMPSRTQSGAVAGRRPGSPEL